MVCPFTYRFNNYVTITWSYIAGCVGNFSFSRGGALPRQRVQSHVASAQTFATFQSLTGRFIAGLPDFAGIMRNDPWCCHGQGCRVPIGDKLIPPLIEILIMGI